MSGPHSSSLQWVVDVHLKRNMPLHIKKEKKELCHMITPIWQMMSGLYSYYIRSGKTVPFSFSPR